MSMSEHPITSVPGVAGGAPTLLGTRLTCANIVYAVHVDGVEALLAVHESLTHADVVDAVEYCSTRSCLQRDGEQTFCGGCTLDTRPYDDLDEPPEDVWMVARALTRRLPRSTTP